LSLCWHVLSTDPPGTKPYVAWGSTEDCPVEHPELYEEYVGEVRVDHHSGEPMTGPLDYRWIPHIFHGPSGKWIRKKVPMDPVRQLTTPIAEVRAAAPQHWIDEYGEAWIMLDGIETKCPSIEAANRLCAHQDAVRVQIRADLDAVGARESLGEEPLIIDGKPVLEENDKGEMVPVMTQITNPNVLQIANFPDGETLIANAQAVQDQADREAADEAARVEHAHLAARTPIEKIRDGIKSLFRKDK